MKRSQIILFSIFIILFGLIYVVLSGNKDEYSKTIKSESKTIYVPITTVENKMQKMSIVSYGQITPNTELMVSFEVQGKLLKGNQILKSGVKFSKGDILYRIDNEEAFYSLSARKVSLANLVLNALPDIELDFPSEKTKWLQFMNDLDPAKLLPELPAMKSNKERMFMTSRNVLTEYYNLKSTEARMEKYLYIAPFSGTVVDVFAEPGSIINPGSQVAKIARSGEFEVKVPIDLADLKIYQELNEATFTNSSGKVIGKGKIIRVSDVINQQTQSADVYYSVHPLNNEKIYHGVFVNVKIDREANKETMTLPRVAVKNNRVNLLVKDKLIEQEVLIVGSKPDTVFVTGLTNGDKVLIEQVDTEVNGAIYKGIAR